MQFWGSGCLGNGLGSYARLIPGFGADLKREVKRRYPAWVELHPFGEVLPYADNRITVDSGRRTSTACPSSASTTGSATTSGR